MDYKSAANKQLTSKEFDKKKLVDISDLSLPGTDAKSKMACFLKSVGNPYLFRVDDIGVHVVFSGKTGDSLQSRIIHLLSSSI